MQPVTRGSKAAEERGFPRAVRCLFSTRFGTICRAFFCLLVAAGAALYAQEKDRGAASDMAANEGLSPQIELTTAEEAWLAENHTVRVRVVDFPPFQIPESNALRGISMDYLRMIAARTGVNFKFNVETRPFADALDGLMKLEGPDLIQCMMRTPERESYVSFTRDYLSYPRVICTEEDAEFVSGMEDLIGSKVAVPRGTVVSKELEARYPRVQLLLCDTDEEALEAVAAGQATAYVCNLTLAGYLIRDHGLANLTVAAPSSLGDHVFAFGVRRDWPELTGIINKALATITPAEKAAIQDRYLSVQYERGIAPETVAKWILGGSAVALVSVLGLILWNRALNRRARKRASDLARSEERFRATFQQAAVGIAHVAPNGRFLRLNQRFCDIVGYPREELLQLTFQDITHPDDLDADVDHVQRLLEGASNTYSMEKRYFRKDGGIVWVNLTVRLLREETGEPRWFVSVVEDITRRKIAEKKIKRYQKRLKALASRLTVAEERERRRIATELHDRISQNIALSRLQLRLAREASNESELETVLDDLSDSLLEANEDVRRLVWDLSTPSMDEIGLGAAIADWLDEQELKRQYAIQTRFKDNVDEARKNGLTEDARAILFRNVRELVTNVIKHAQADTVDVTLDEKNSCLRVTVRDDGVGFDADDVLKTGGEKGGFGLFSIEERMAELGGSIKVQSEPGEGCTVILSLPLE